MLIRRAKRHRWQRLIRVLRSAIALYAAVLLLGLLPVNTDFQPATSGVEIGVVSTLIHADIVLPVQTDVIDWRTLFPVDRFISDTKAATHVAIGWGDRDFFPSTPSLTRLSVPKLIKALFWPTPSCLHVTMLSESQLAPTVRRITLTTAQYQALVDALQASLQTDATRQPIQIDATHHRNDAFFEARGRYSFLDTCNSWAGRKLRRAELPAGRYTPLPNTLLIHWPKDLPASP